MSIGYNSPLAGYAADSIVDRGTPLWGSREAVRARAEADRARFDASEEGQNGYCYGIHDVVDSHRDQWLPYRNRALEAQYSVLWAFLDQLQADEAAAKAEAKKQKAAADYRAATSPFAALAALKVR